MQVARAHGQPPHVVAGWPAAWVLLACLSAMRAERTARALAHLDGLRAARRAAVAYHQPRDLEAMQRAMQTQFATADARARGERPADSVAAAKAAGAAALAVAAAHGLLAADAPPDAPSAEVPA